MYKLVSAKGNLLKNNKRIGGVNVKFGQQILISESYRERNQCNNDNTQSIIKFIGNGSKGLSSNNAV